MLVVLDKEVRRSQRAGGPPIEKRHHRPGVAFNDVDAKRMDVEQAKDTRQQDEEVTDQSASR